MIEGLGWTDIDEQEEKYSFEGERNAHHSVRAPFKHTTITSISNPRFHRPRTPSEETIAKLSQWRELEGGRNPNRIGGGPGHVFRKTKKFCKEHPVAATIIVVGTVVAVTVTVVVVVGPGAAATAAAGAAAALCEAVGGEEEEIAINRRGEPLPAGPRDPNLGRGLPLPDPRQSLPVPQDFVQFNHPRPNPSQTIPSPTHNQPLPAEPKPISEEEFGETLNRASELANASYSKDPVYEGSGVLMNGVFTSYEEIRKKAFEEKNIGSSQTETIKPENTNQIFAFHFDTKESPISQGFINPDSPRPNPTQTIENLTYNVSNIPEHTPLLNPEPTSSFHSKDPVYQDRGVVIDGVFNSYEEMREKLLKEKIHTPWIPDPHEVKVDIPIPTTVWPQLELKKSEPVQTESLWTRFLKGGPGYFHEWRITMLEKTHLLTNYYDRSRIFETSGKTESHLAIGMINGINTSFEEVIGHAENIGRFVPGMSISGVYNQDHGLISNLGEALFINYPGYSANTAPLLRQQWTEFHERNLDRPNVKYLQFCHSQGAIHTRNALLLCPPEIRNRVIVIAIAPGAIVPREICFNSYNYASKKDIVHLGELLHAGSLETKETGISPVLESILNQRNELILLEPHPDVTWIGIDHDFRSLTFDEIKEMHTNEYIAQNGEYE